MSESKSQQPLSYGQPVVEPDFSPRVCSRVQLNPQPDDDIIFSRHVCHCEGDELCIVCQFEPVADEDDLCEFDCTRFAGWLPADDYFIACPCNIDARGLAA